MLFSTLEDAYITVITATYNSSRFLEKSLVSLLEARKNIPNTQIAHLVVDGYSTDATLDIVRRCSPSSIIVQREKAGIYDALNYGVSLVQSPYLMYLHSDDELDAKFLAEMVRVMQNHSWREDILPYGTVSFIDKESNHLFSRKPPFYIGAMQKLFAIICHPNGVYLTKVEKKHPFDINIGLEADRFHILEIAKKLRPVRAPRAVYRFRLSTSSSTTVSPQEKPSLPVRMLARIYPQLLFETHLLERFLVKIFTGRSYWTPR